ncbi:hypothetical protein SBA1_480054 [Candidatus Sulfotelmatobacter kueseliae]|uniref:Uncharacterized protein n=1 Tax=Candidatus Sulfotelmatobacter kueseliae TaxID=2042962 RepID=A0A2U3KU48_9BACT|nr:hypothetical protein SBA1_480054 [Candidatus Sulfotelmatobacter kueseliae]
MQAGRCLNGTAGIDYGIFGTCTQPVLFTSQVENAVVRVCLRLWRASHRDRDSCLDPGAPSRSS